MELPIESDVPPAPLVPAVESLEDAHDSWHEAVDAYHTPRELRRRIDQVVQALRNVTFRLQASKHDLPEFDSWYRELWVPFMKNDRHMKWLQEARTEVVKRSGLNSASRASVSVIHSYLEAPRHVGSVPATKPTEDIVRETVDQIPNEVRPHSAIEITRMWEVPELEGEDLLFVFAWCFHVLDALLVYAGEAVLKGEPPAQAPADFVQTVEWLRCMDVPPSLIPLLIAADTQEPFDISFEKRHSEADQDAALERYGLSPIDPPEDPVDFGKKIHERARTILKRDGQHIPLLLLRRPSGQWEPRVVFTEDRRDKYVLWHRLAREVAAIGHDALVMTTETWTVPTQSIRPTGPYPPDLAEHPDRSEALITWAETADGRSAMWSSEIVRILGKPYLKEARSQRDVEGSAGFAAPVKRIWAARPEGAPGRRRESNTTSQQESGSHESRERKQEDDG